MGVSYRELRKTCQVPVRDGNDVAGLLFGDFASLPITKLFVDLRLSPDYASVGFLVAGVVGAFLQAGAGWVAFAGAALLVLYYVLDCVDGEVARYQKVTSAIWGYYDNIFHMLVKPMCFFGVGLGTFLSLDHAWPLILAFTASTATLWLKNFLVIPGLIFLRDALGRYQRTGEVYSGAFRARVTDDPPTPSPPGSGKFKVRLDMVTLRALMTNFDIGLLALLAAAGLDVLLAPLELPLFGTMTWRGLWLLHYGVVLPLDFADYVVTYLRKGHFSSEMERLVGLAHGFSAEVERPKADET